MTDSPDIAVGCLEKAAELLRRPFMPDLVLWRPVRPDVGVIGPVGQVAPYINRELVIDRLNVVCPGLWSMRYEVVPGASGSPLMWCHLTIDGVTRPDVGEGAGKTLVTDALKRAAKNFGVGVCLGAMPRVEFNVGDTDRFKLKRVGTDVILTEVGRTACQRHYSDWLDRVGTAAYGEPLPHGAPDQRRPIRGDSNADLADQHAGDDAERATLVARAAQLAERNGVEAPVIADSIGLANLRSLVALLEDASTSPGGPDDAGPAAAVAA